MEIVYHLSLCCRTEKMTKKNLKIISKRGREEKRRGEGVYERHHVGGGAKQLISSPFAASHSMPACPSGGTFQSPKLV
jgi:hypothetical protein